MDRTSSTSGAWSARARRPSKQITGAVADLAELLAGPDDPVDPGHFGKVEAVVGMRGVEAPQLDTPGGAAGKLLGHDLAAAVRTTTRSPRRIGAAGETMTMSPSRNTGSIESPLISSA